MAYAGTISFADGTVLHQWLLIESSDQLAEMCVKEGLSALCDAKAESRRKEVLGERLLMKKIFGIDTPIMHNADRMPYIENSDSHISIAHTKGYLAIALNHHHCMGIDVEQYQRRVLNVRNGFLNEAEQQWLKADDELAHMIAWTAKEAIFKTIGDRSRVKSYRNEIIIHPFATPHIGRQISHIGTFKSEDFALQTLLTDTHILTLSTKK
ncbi:MAG: 4'-phosphopantetheinyl transferase superfamily protein [Bacteroidales bacterium]|nr:4'-phosphopantetheinyl transferase superfamily protein [Bacteroidales bacterium]